MNEKIFRAGYVEMFNETHPAADGWLVFQESKHAKLNTGLIPEFLRAKHPDWIKKMTISEVVSENKEHSTRAPGEVRLTPYGWVGAVEIKIGEQEIHFRAYNDAFNNGMWVTDECMFLAAVKDKALLEKFYSELLRFKLEYDEPRRKILGGDGADLPKPKVTWDDIILPGKMAEDLRSSTEAFFKAGQRYKELGLAYKRGYIFAGPPGNGKTLASKIIAANEETAFVTIQPSQMRDWGLDAAFETARQHAPSVLLIEDLDRLSNPEVVVKILSLMDSFDVSEGVLVIATINDINRLDAALVHRPSRFDRIWEFSLPAQPQRLAMLRKLGGKHFSHEAMEKTAAQTEGFSMAYVQEVFTNALLLAVSRGEDINDGHLAESLAVLKKQFKSSEAKEGLKSQHAPDSMGFKPE
jgi:hypothetical protein